MATCSTPGCGCKNFYTDWIVGQRTGDCEDCHHSKTLHSREIAHQPAGHTLSSVPMYCIKPFPSHICNICILFDDIVLSVSFFCRRPGKSRNPYIYIISMGSLIPRLGQILKLFCLNILYFSFGDIFINLIMYFS